MTTPSPQLAPLIEEIRACKVCAQHLPLGPKPIVHLGTTAKILLIGQAPGTRVHATGIPWNDPSGDNLRGWLGLSREAFYDTANIAIMPMGFCYPGKGRSGDLPPRPECAALWHENIRQHLPAVQITLLIGHYAQDYYLRDRKRETLTETVRHWRDYLALGYWPLVHPSPRNRLWMKRNPWFEKDVTPALRRAVKRALGA